METKGKVIAMVINDVLYDQRMIRICSTLQEQGYEVTLVGRRKEQAAMIGFPFKTKRFRLPLQSGPLFYILYNVRLFFYLLFRSFDILHAVDLDTLSAAYVIARIRRKALVYDAHEYFTEVPELLHRPRKRAIWLRLEALILPRLKYAITVGEKIAEEYKKKYGLHFEVVRNCPVLQEAMANTGKDAGKYLIYQGALNKGRGLEALIEAMTSIEIPLKIAGSGDLDESLRKQVKALGLEHKVEFLGNIPPQELRTISSAAFAGINVSENLGLSYYYSLNNKFFDYIHAGIPAITNAFPEYMALNKIHDCVIFADANIQSIRTAVNLLVDDTMLYGKLKKNCLLARQSLNWTEEEKRLLAVYAKI